MLIEYKLKNHLIYYFEVIFLFIIIRRIHLLLFALVLVIAFMSYSVFTSSLPTTAPVATNTIVIDAGHGGMDGGAVGDTGTLEKDINLKVAMFLKDIAESDGKTVIMTRTDDTSLHTTDSNKIRNQKRSDLENRKKTLNESGALAFISIHMNKFEQSKYKGAQVFYANNDKSKILGEKIQARLISGLNDGNTRVAKTVPNEVYILKGTTAPAAVVECGFLSNAEEEALLTQTEYQKKLATYMYEGFKDYIAQGK